MAGQEIDRLNQVLKGKSDEASSLDSKLRSTIHDMDALKRRNQEMESSVVIDLQSKISMYEQRTTSISQEN